MNPTVAALGGAVSLAGCALALAARKTNGNKTVDDMRMGALLRVMYR
jgi:hypothetical protein